MGGRVIPESVAELSGICKYTFKEKWSELLKYYDSSLAGYIATGKQDPMVNYRMVLGYMGGVNRKGRNEYKTFLQQAITGEVENPIALGKGSSVIGTNEFIEWVKEKVLKDKGNTREQPALLKMRKSIDTQSLIDIFCKITNKNKEEICLRGNRTTERFHLMELLYRYCDITQPEIGKLLGGIDYSAVSQARKRFREKLKVDKKLKRKCSKIEEQIVNSPKKSS